MRRNPWLISPAWDGCWILNTLWLAPITWWFARGRDEPSNTGLFWVYLVLSLGFWIGHRLSSSYLAYCTSAYRPLLRSQSVRFVWLPLAIVIAVFAILLPVDDALPWSRATRSMVLVIVDYGLVTYHFASQHFGFLRLYRARAGQTHSERARRFDRTYALLIGGLMVFVAELIAGTVFFQNVWLDPIFDPRWLAEHFETIQWSGASLVVSTTAGMLLVEVRNERSSLPLALYMICMATIVAAAFFVTPYVFVVLWTSQHWLAAMGLAIVVARTQDTTAGAARRPSAWYRLWGAVSRRPWALTLVLVGLSALMLPIMEVEALDEGEPGFAEKIVPTIADALSNSAWVHALVAIGFVTAFLHYALDRAVFRLSDREVRHAARGLFEARKGFGK
jgi:hypothetical protein